MDKRADVIPEAAVEAVARRFYIAHHDKPHDPSVSDLRDARLLLAHAAAAAPLLPGGEEAERLIRSLWDLWGEERIATQMGADTVERFKRVLARPDAERAPQEDRCECCGHPPHAPTSACPASYGFGAPSMPVPTRSSEPRPQGDEVETVARTWWAHDPEAFDSLDERFKELQRTRARAVLAALDARSGADTVKLADVVRAFLSETPVEHPAIGQIRYDAPAAVRYRETRAAVWDALVSGADRPEGSPGFWQCRAVIHGTVPERCDTKNPAGSRRCVCGADRPEGSQT